MSDSIASGAGGAADGLAASLALLNVGDDPTPPTRTPAVSYLAPPPSAHTPTSAARVSHEAAAPPASAGAGGGGARGRPPATPEPLLGRPPRLPTPASTGVNPAAQPDWRMAMATETRGPSPMSRGGLFGSRRPHGGGRRDSSASSHGSSGASSVGSHRGYRSHYSSGASSYRSDSDDAEDHAVVRRFRSFDGPARPQRGGAGALLRTTDGRFCVMSAIPGQKDAFAGSGILCVDAPAGGITSADVAAAKRALVCEEESVAVLNRALVLTCVREVFEETFGAVELHADDVQAAWEAGSWVDVHLSTSKPVAEQKIDRLFTVDVGMAASELEARIRAARQERPSRVNVRRETHEPVFLTGEELLAYHRAAGEAAAQDAARVARRPRNAPPYNTLWVKIRTIKAWLGAFHPAGGGAPKQFYACRNVAAAARETRGPADGAGAWRR